MKKSFTLTKENFENLLDWLSADREKAGAKYEEIRKGLIRFFRIRDCADPLALTDDTLNRVAGKLPMKATEREKIPLKYIYGFAINIFREYERISTKNEIQLEQQLPLVNLITQESSITERTDLNCLEQCLTKFTPEDREMIIEYYGQEKNNKFEFRRRMAAGKQISVSALHTKIHRLKNNLRKCVEKCMDEKNL